MRLFPLKNKISILNFLRFGGLYLYSQRKVVFYISWHSSHCAIMILTTPECSWGDKFRWTSIHGWACVSTDANARKIKEGKLLPKDKSTSTSQRILDTHCSKYKVNLILFLYPAKCNYTMNKKNFLPYTKAPIKNIRAGIDCDNYSYCMSNTWFNIIINDN